MKNINKNLRFIKPFNNKMLMAKAHILGFLAPEQGAGPEFSMQ
jgi:hypothetical protein